MLIYNYRKGKQEREVNTMMMTKAFDYKGQMINYFNKMKNNPKLVFLMSCMSTQTGKWTIYYEYKKI